MLCLIIMNSCNDSDREWKKKTLIIDTYWIAVRFCFSLLGLTLVVFISVSMTSSDISPSSTSPSSASPSSKSLANKYRPSTFDQLVEQSHIVDVLKAQLLNGHSHSNYIFFWPRGTGKTTTARIFAKALNCPNNAQHRGNPCGTCESCLMIAENKAVDIIEIDAASYTWVDNIRDEIISKASYPPAGLTRKVYIIDEVHILSKGAFNALLKIMEEPPPYLTFILATTEIHKVPDTIISRCQLFQFRKLSYDAIVAQLEKICASEWFAYDIQALWLIAKLSDGCDRDAIKYVDQVSMFWDVSVEHVSSLLGVVWDHVIQEFINQISQQNLTDVLAHIQYLHGQWIDLMILADQMLAYIDVDFVNNVSLYLPLTDVFKSIISASKVLPHPLIAYKMEFARFLNDQSSSQSGTMSSDLVREQPSLSAAAISHSASPSSSWLSPVASEPISQSINPSPSIIEQVVSSSIPLDTPPVVSAPHQSTESLMDDMIKDAATDTGILYKQLVSGLSKASLKTLLANNGLLDEIVNHVATIIIFQKLAYDHTNKADVIQEMQHSLRILAQDPLLNIHLRFMTREDYVTHQLG